MDYLNKSLSRRSSQRSSRASSPLSSRFSRRAAPRKLNLALVEDPLLATMAAANSSMPLTPPADESTFQNLDASTKMPDTPMADQFAIDDLESEQSEPTLDVQKGHLVTHAKVYAIAEKYVSPFVIVCFSSFCLITRPSPLVSFHLRLQICFALAWCCAGLHGGRRPTNPALCVTDMDQLQSIGQAHVPWSDLRLSTAYLPFFVFAFLPHAQSASCSVKVFSCIFETNRVSM